MIGTLLKTDFSNLLQTWRFLKRFYGFIIITVSFDHKMTKSYNSIRVTNSFPCDGLVFIDVSLISTLASQSFSLHFIFVWLFFQFSLTIQLKMFRRIPWISAEYIFVFMMYWLQSLMFVYCHRVGGCISIPWDLQRASIQCNK